MNGDSKITVLDYVYYKFLWESTPWADRDVVCGHIVLKQPTMLAVGSVKVRK